MTVPREIEFAFHGELLDLENINTPLQERIAVYTAVFAGYDDLPHLSNIDERLDYFVFTDGTITDAPHPWQVRQIAPIFADPQRDARRVKLMPHLFLPQEYAISVWIDASLAMRQLTVEVIAEVLGDAHVAVCKHSVRNCVYAEAKTVLDVKYDSAGRVHRQMSYYAQRGLPADFGLHATMFLVRRHLDGLCMGFNLDWWEQLSRFSKRDQLSFDYTRWRNSAVAVRTLALNHSNNPIFTFKMKDGKEHKSSHRVTDETLHVGLRAARLLSPESQTYSSEYELYAPAFLGHVRNLNRIIAASDEMPQANLCYAGNQADFLYSPPMPSKGEDRELFLRTIAGRTRLFESAFSSGHSSIVALTETSISVTALYDGNVSHDAACAAYLSSYFQDRFVHTALEPMTLLNLIDDISFELYDAIHINAARPIDLVVYDLACAVTHGTANAVLVVSELKTTVMKRLLAFLAAQNLIARHGDLESATAAAYLIRPDARQADAEDLIVRMVSLIHSIGVPA